MGCAAQRPNEYPVDNQLASWSRWNSDEIGPAAAMTSVPSALEMNSPGCVSICPNSEDANLTNK